jgi:pyruvate/2-oxoglutarate/acetoin dehydrogenase E1 component
MVHHALQVAEELSREGIALEVVDLRTLVPLDEETLLDSVRRTNRVVVASEANRTCGFAAEVAARITERAFKWLDAPVVRVTAADVPTPFAPTLEQEVLPSAQRLKAAVLELLRF